MRKAAIKFTANILMFSMVLQLVMPLRVYALTSGPSQPEVESFEPVGTTEMVDMFTGDFTYNIPLMDVEGFPINISYHGGANIEQEASWVGLGWNINPGEINRTVRGIPDDFNGDTIEKKINIKPEKDFRATIGAETSLEFFGLEKKVPRDKRKLTKFSVNASTYVAHNNYKGVAVGFNVGASVNLPYVTVGVGAGIGSQSGADVDFNAGFHASKKINEDMGSGTIGISGGTGFNTRTGLKDFSFGISASSSKHYAKGKREGNQSTGKMSFGGSVPIGVINYVPVITNASVQNTFQFQARFGAEVFYGYPNAYLNIMMSTLRYDSNGSRKSYGYLYAENASKADIMDFSREKDGFYNNTLKNLPLASMTYDIYSVSGQGTGGMFRPFRNDIGAVYDPEVKPPVSTSNELKLEGGLGNLFELGTDFTNYTSESYSGPWKSLPFKSDMPGTLFEKAYFKQAGEMTYNGQMSTSSIFNENPVYIAEDEYTLLNKNKQAFAHMPARDGNSYIYTGSTTDRTARANLLTYFTGRDADTNDILQSKKVLSFRTQAGDSFCNPHIDEYARHGTAADRPKKHHATEFTQTLPDGRRYIYGTPAINNVTREVTFSVSGNENLGSGLVKIDRTDADHKDDAVGNKKGRDNFYSHTGTPAYAYSYLLSSVLSKDYVDVLGDGPTDDDLGSFTKINYTRLDSDYRWRAPYGNDSAQYSPGYWCDRDDDRGSYIMGSKQIWHIRSVETKNYVAEFYISPRDDGKGLNNAILPAGSYLDAGGKYSQSRSGEPYSYKLDSIRLFNKHDRYLNESTTGGTPIKTVIFRYSYRLCRGIPNTYNSTITATTGGKLTLERIYIKYGNSQKNLLSPYVFTYSETNPDYSFASKDRWGNYQPQASDITSFEYPYVRQEAPDVDNNASAWSLAGIKLPSGGNIHVQYESDDYSYVQDRRTMQMFKVEGVGNSSNKDNRTTLYESVDQVNNYVYFKRRKSIENNSLSMKDNYLEGVDLLYYSFNLDISGTGKYEHINGYAAVESVGVCPNNDNYGYVKLKREEAGTSGHYLHPATIYGLNVGKYYLPQIIYPGYRGDVSGPLQILQGLRESLGELLSITQNPIVRFVEKDKKGKNIRPGKSWVRLNIPGLTKKGGGSRVKQLTIDDAWNHLTTNTDSAVYGKVYDYTVWDGRWNRNVSSGVASYEPMVGGDENPFRMPVPYTLPAERLLPATAFFQETPFGESFFPSPVVGYSHVAVKSIHAANARSAQFEEHYEYYTAKDFPIEISYSDIDAPPPIQSWGINKKSDEVRPKQGYQLRFNDMHGKLKKNAYCVIRSDGSNTFKDTVSYAAYSYQTNGIGKLDNTVNAVVRNRGGSDFSVQSIKLGEEMDFTIDSREKDIHNSSFTFQFNCNVVSFPPFVVPIPTVFFYDKDERINFKSLVSTKIIQQYGVLKSVETYDHGAKIITENTLYDAETGAVLLTTSNNEYKDPVYDIKFPAHWYYKGMGPAYTNAGYEETGNTLTIEPNYKSTGKSSFYGDLLVGYADRFNPGDELLLSYSVGGTPYNVKVWTLGEWHPSIDSIVSHSITDTIIGILPGGGGGSHIYYDTFRTHSPYYEGGWSGHFRVVPRYIFKNGTPQWPGGLSAGSVVSNVTVKVLKSGRRNNLDQDAGMVKLKANPFNTDFNKLVGNDHAATAYNKVLDVGITTFADDAKPYYSDSGLNADFYKTRIDYYYPDIYASGMLIGGDTLKVFNRYVLGHYGNYRPGATYTYNAARDYSDARVRNNATYSILDNYYWTNKLNYIRLNEPTRYDVFGNLIEETDALRKYSSAQYGFNRSLPVAVASNARQHSFSFEGFEDYATLVPAYLRSLFINYYYYFTPFSKVYNETAGSFTRAGQHYVTLDLSPSNGDSITSLYSHTGNYSLKCAESRAFHMPVRSIPLGYNPQVYDFSLDRGRKYVASVWFKPVAGYTVADGTEGISITLHDNSGTTAHTFQVKTPNIDGWYKAECVLDITANITDAWFNLSGNAYIDDVRFVPLDAAMKSFVYDPVSFKLSAQLDENNFASFYEYDQEGLLVRTKKETEKGVMTITENRRSNNKR